MSIVFIVPAPLRALAGNREQIRVDGTAGSLSQALTLLWAECPPLRDRVLTELGEVRPHVNIFVDGENTRHTGGLDTPVRDGAEVMLLPAISGGDRDHDTSFFFMILMVLAGFVIPAAVNAQERVRFTTEDGAVIHGDAYGRGDRAVVLAHGGRFNKESWSKQAWALAGAGFRVLAIDFRGYGESRGPGDSSPMDAPLHLDVLGAVRHLRKGGAKSVSVVGGSMGGSAAGDASITGAPGEIDRLVLLAADGGGPPEKLKSRTLFIVSRDDADGTGTRRLARIRARYERAPQPKKFVLLEGSAHAQFLFETDQGERLMSEILRFLSEP